MKLKKQIMPRGILTAATRLMAGAATITAVMSGALITTAHADETCMSPYMAKIVGQEDYVYTWTLGQEGLGDEQDKLVTVDVDPKSDKYGEIINVVSVGGRNEAHHGGFTDDRRFLWVAGLDSNKIFIFDVATDPAAPKLTKVITDFVSETGGLVGPHTHYAMPGRMLVSALSNNKDHGGRSGLAEYTNDGEYVKTYWNPTDEDLQGADKSGKYADGYGYDIAALPSRNVFITTSFTGWNNYMQDFGKMLQDPESMKHFGNTVVVWDLHTRKPKKILDVPGAPLEIRCTWSGVNNYCFTTTALTSKVWLLYEDDKGEWQSEDVGDIGDPSKVPLPVDISITADDKGLWINTFTDGTSRYFDITNPHKVKEVFKEKIGNQVNMVSQSWDGKRVYYTTSLLSNWDKTGKEQDQYFKAYSWDADKLKLTEDFSLDFIKLKLGLPHIMRFGDRELYASNPKQNDEKKVAQSDAK